MSSETPSSRPSSPSSSIAEMQVATSITHRQTMRGHIDRVTGVVHLSDERRIITCSRDSSLRLWDVENGTQIGNGWRDKGDDEQVLTIALSPNSKRVASGSRDGTVKLWDVDTGKVIARWTEHGACVESVCWSPNGERVLSGSWDGTARVWNVESGETILGPIKTKQEYVFAVAYSPDGSKFATGGYNSAIKIWDSATGEFLHTLGHDVAVVCLTWSSDGKKLIFWSSSLIIIFDTVTWQQIAVLEGHKTAVSAITLSHNDRLLASTSWDGHDQTRLWDLDTNLQIGPPLHHEKEVYCAAFSADGTRLVTGCDNRNAYMWDVGAILKEHHLEHLLPVPDDAGKSFLGADATGAEQGDAHQPPQGFFSDTQENVDSSATRQPRLPARYRLGTLASSLTSRPTALFKRIFSLLRPQPNTDVSTENIPPTPITSSVPTTSPVPITSSVPIASPVPITSSVPIASSVPITSSVPISTTARDSLPLLSRWWPIHASHLTPSSIVDTPFAQGKKRIAAAGAPTGSDDCVLDEDYVSPPPSPSSNQRQTPTTVLGTTGEHGGGRLCLCW